VGNKEKDSSKNVGSLEKALAYGWTEYYPKSGKARERVGGWLLKRSGKALQMAIGFKSKRAGTDSAALV